MVRLRAWLQHRLNEAALYCRFKDCGLGTHAAKRLGRVIGRCFKPLIYRGRG